MAADGRVRPGIVGTGARPLEADLVSRLRVRDVHLPGDGVGHHVEENRAHAGVRHPHLGRRAPRGIDHEHVLVEQREADGVVPVPAELVLPRVVCRVELDDRARLGLRIAEAVDVGGGEAAGHDEAGDAAGAGRRPAVAHQALAQRRGLVAGLEDRRVDGVAVGTRGERTRGVAEERELGERRAAEHAAEVRHVEHPDVGASDALGGEVRQRHAAVLSAVRGGDEGAVAARPGEHDVAWLVADQERADDARRARAHVDDAHAVREVVDDPDVHPVAVGRGRDRLEADGDGAGVREVPLRVDVEDLEPVVGGVHRVEVQVVRRERERADLAGLEGDE